MPGAAGRQPGRGDAVAQAVPLLGAADRVVDGAGGRVTDWAGQPLRLEGDGRALAVGDAALLAEAVELLAG